MELIWDCLVYDPEQRLSMSQYLKHDYLTYEPKQSPPSPSSQPSKYSSSSQQQSQPTTPQNNSSSRHRGSSTKKPAGGGRASRHASPSSAPVTSTSRSRASSTNTRRKGVSSDRDWLITSLMNYRSHSENSCGFKICSDSILQKRHVSTK